MKRLPAKRALSVAEQREAYGKALEQSAALLDEANLLAKHGRYAGAVHRLVIALEELGKVRLIALQGMVAVGRKQSSWEPFWKAYYSHEAKLHEALLWGDAENVIGSGITGEKIEREIRRVQFDAKRLDLAKQDASYSGPVGNDFTRPSDREFESQAQRLLATAQSLFEFARSHPLSKAQNKQEFKQALELAFRHASVLGYDKAESFEEFLEAVAEANRPLYALEGAQPSQEALIQRVAERYEVLPALLPVTLAQLRADAKFKRFYSRLRLRHGYPDWMILGTIYNIVLHARVDVEAYTRESRLSELWMWAEDETSHAPLELRLFTHMETFDLVLDRWLAAFLAGVGLAVPPGTSADKGVRRIAARHLDIFNIDVEHAPIF